MPGITGLGTTFELPNFVGELFLVTPTDTPFLSAIGGLTGGRQAVGTYHQWTAYDLRDPSQRTKPEGEDAPEGEARVRWNIRNVVEIHQEAVRTSYTKQAAVGQFSDTGSDHPHGAGLAGPNAVGNEHAFQLSAELKAIARDLEFSFIQGTFVEPADNTTARQTRGILEAIEELPPGMSTYDPNVIPGGAGALDEDMVLNLLQMVWENGGIREQETATLMTGAFQKRALTNIFITEKNYQEQSRNVAGVNVTTIETDFGRLNVMLNRYMPADELAVVSLEECAPVFLLVPGRGFLFVEPLAKTGASENDQIYGEIGLEYGNPLAHGKITGLATS